MRTFSVTFETITPESAGEGDFADMGFVARDVSLREAIDLLGCGEEGVETSDSRIDCARWITAFGTHKDYGTGETENRSLHFPDSLTPSTRRRIARHLRCV